MYKAVNAPVVVTGKNNDQFIIPSKISLYTAFGKTSLHIKIGADLVSIPLEAVKELQQTK